MVVTERGGHLSDALRLLEQLRLEPEAVLVSDGPEAASVASARRTFVLPHLFSWLGSRRVLNPIRAAHHVALTLVLAWKLRPALVLSFGAYSTPCFCYWARLLGARIVHIECLNVVERPSRTARLLLPICSDVFVQWPGLADRYRGKGRYGGWVL